MKKRKKELFSQLLLIVLVVLSAITIYFYFTGYSKALVALFTLGMILIVFIGSLNFVSKAISPLKNHINVHDKRSAKIFTLACARAFMISLYILLTIGFLSTYNVISFRDVGHAAGISILLMVLTLGLCLIYYNRKNDHTGS